MRKAMMWLLAVITYLPMAAQVTNHATIDIKAETQVNGQAFDIGISDMGKQIKLVYRVRDSISVLAENDPVLEAYRKKAMSLTHFSPQNDTVMELLQKIVAVRQRYSYYSMDSMTIQKKDNPDYVKLFATVLDTPIDSLEQRANNRNRIVLDGTGFDIAIRQNGLVKKVYAHSPTEASHPLIYDLLKNTFALYRTGHPQSALLQRGYTSGY
jgi:hypothetical protein